MTRTNSATITTPAPVIHPSSCLNKGLKVLFVAFGAIALIVSALILLKVGYFAKYDFKTGCGILAGGGVIELVALYCCCKQKGRVAIKHTPQPSVTREEGTALATRIRQNLNAATGQKSGSGSQADVFFCTSDPRFVIKKYKQSMNNPPNPIGQRLDHPLICRSHATIELSSGEYKRYAVLLDRIEGNILTQQQSSFTKQQLRHLVQQTKDCALYLFDQNVRWNDTNPDNIMITPQGDLRFIDLDLWSQVNEADLLFANLLEGGVGIMQSLFAKSLLKAFKAEMRINDTFTYPPSEDNYSTFIGKIKWQVSTMNKNQLKALLAAYFDAVLAQIPNT